MNPTEDTPTPERVEVITRWGKYLKPFEEISVDGGESWWTKDQFKRLQEIKTTAQLQLVSELEGKLPEFYTGTVYGSEYEAGRNTALDQVKALLEHKKQELERGK